MSSLLAASSSMMFFSFSLPQLPFLDTGYFFYHNGIAKARRRRSLQHKLHLEKDSRVSVSSLYVPNIFFVTHTIFYEIGVMIKYVVMATFFSPVLVSSLVTAVCTHLPNSLILYLYFTATNTLTYSEMYTLSSKTQ